MAPGVHPKRCVNGHEFTPENTYHRKDGYRDCKACSRERDKTKQKALRVKCPDCGESRTLKGHGDQTRCRTYADYPCGSCAQRRRWEFGYAHKIAPASEFEAFWRSRFSQHEIDELWAAVSLYLDLPLEQAA